MTDEAKGTRYFGLHFYPGIAGYKEDNGKTTTVFLNEDTLRSMDPTFAVRPVFVLHVDEVETDLNELRKEADGWVVRSFYNEADGKHWAEFLVVSDKGERAVKQGMKLSNCYVPTKFGPKGTWNGIDYDKEITAGTYEHLAIVPNPRYEESVIMTPEEFAKYNEEKRTELKKLSNNNPKGDSKMKLSFFKRAKVDNSADLETMSVVLPKSATEVSLIKLINDADDKEMKKEEPVVAQGHHLVDCNGKTMTVNDMVKKYKDMEDSMEEMKKPKEEKMDDEDKDHEKDPAAENDEDQDMEVAKKPMPESEDDKKGEKRALKLEEEEEKEVKDEKKKNALEKAERLRNANKNLGGEVAKVFLSEDATARGKALYGSK